MRRNVVRLNEYKIMKQYESMENKAVGHDQVFGVLTETSSSMSPEEIKRSMMKGYMELLSNSKNN